MTTLEVSALDLARRLHAGQVDKVGVPYWHHCLRVARRLVQRWSDASTEEIHAAYLHDVLEDTATSSDDLAGMGISEHTIEIIEIVTKTGPYAAPGMPYLDWIKAIADLSNVSAMRVKLADLADSSDWTRLPWPPEFMQRVQQRYAPAKLILETKLRELGYADE